MKKIITVALAVTLLSACASPETMSEADWQKLNNDQLCKLAKTNPLDVRVIAHLEGRKLHCHPAELTCKAAGITQKDGKKYNDCMSAAFAQLQADEIKRQQAFQALGALGAQMQQNSLQQQAIMNSRRPINTSCHQMGSFVNCSTY